MCLLAVGSPVSLVAQDWIKVSPEEAQSHLLRKVEPVYPPFAEAAGIEGIVQVNVGIYTDGRIHSLMGSTGPDALFRAAQDVVGKSVYKPFLKDGRLVNAATIVAVTFKLPLGKARSYPAPTLSDESFKEDEGDVVPSHAFSPAMKKWLAKDVEADIEDCSSFDDEELRVRMRKHTTITRLPTGPGTNPIYVARREDPCGCGGASANCSMAILEETPRGITTVAKMQAWGYALRRRPGALYPDIFFAQRNGGGHSDVTGYANLGGQWGQLFCGSIGEKDDMHQCP